MCVRDYAFSVVCHPAIYTNAISIIIHTEICETLLAIYRVDVGIMSQMVLWVHPIITGYQKTSVVQRKGVNQAYIVLRVVMVR